MKIVVVPSRRNSRDWAVEIRQGVQSFRLDYSGSRKDCYWMAMMFRKALRDHDQGKKK